MNEALLRRLTAINGVSGQEEAVRNSLIEEITPFAETLRVDSIGNLIVEKRGEKTPSRKIMVCAHMDEVGLIIKKITSDGFLKFGCVGGIDRKVLIGKRVKVGKNGIDGVIGVKAVHLLEKEEKKTAPSVEKLYIDIGAASKEEAETVVDLGDYAAFSGEYIAFGEGKICAKALDDRAGCAVMCELMQEEQKYDSTFVFTVQEEVGLRGAQVAAYQERPDFVLVLETTSAADFLEKREQWVSQCGGGVVISVMDRGTIYDRELINIAVEEAQKHGIAYQMKQSIAGGNDAGALQRGGEGAKVLALSLPCRYLHTSACVIDQRDFEAMKALAGKILARLGGLCDE